MVGLFGFRQDDRFGGAGGGPAHSVGMLAVGIGRADDPEQQRIAGRTRHPGSFRQILQAKKHALAGAAAHVDGWNSDLWRVAHGVIGFPGKTRLG